MTTATTTAPVTHHRLVPCEADYALLHRWRIIGVILLCFVSCLSLTTPFIPKGQAALSYVLGFANFFMIIAYYVVSIVTEVFLYPATSRLRRITFLDNSLGSKLAGQASQNYFTNDVIQPGPYKMAINCFENCFFTYNIARSMHWTLIPKNVIFSSIFLVLAYVGLKDSLLALPILQVLLSSLFLTQLIYHLSFVSRLRALLERFKQFVTTKDRLGRNNLQQIMPLMLEYETTLALNRSPQSNRAYRRLRDRLTQEWEALKTYYEIGA